jgi:hypothetical protein
MSVLSVEQTFSWIQHETDLNLAEFLGLGLRNSLGLLKTMYANLPFAPFQSSVLLLPIRHNL